MDHLLMLLLLLWSSGLQTEGKHQSPGSQCDSKADIVMLVDESGSIGPRDFSIMKSFLRQIVHNIDIGPDKVQIGLVQFSGDPKTEWELNKHQTEQSLLEAINRVRQLGGGTETGKALQHVLRNNFKPDVGMRADSQKIVVLITDGESQDDVSLVSEHLRDSGIEIYAIGVGGAKLSQLLEITADPAHVYMVDDFDALQHIVNGLTINICANSSLACKYFPGDLFFLIDSSGSIEPEDYNKMKDFMKSVISKSVIGQDEVRVGVMQYSTVQQVEFTLNQYYSKRDMSNAIDAMRQIGGGTHTGEAITALSQYFDIARRGRPQLRQRLVVITDGESQDEVKNPAAALRAKGVVIYAIGVVDASTIELLEISGSRDRVYSEEDFDALKDLDSKVAFVRCDPERDCKTTEKADIIFLVDGSTSISLAKFRSMLKFMQSMVNQTIVGKDLTRFGVIMYSNDPQSVFTLKDYTSKQQVLKAINALRSPNGNTYTGKALEYSRQFFSAENGGRAALQVPQILMVITDGDATDPHSLTKPSVALRDEGVTVFSIGVEGANKTQLEIIAGQDKSRVFYVDNFNTLETLYKDITEALCNIKPDSVRLVNGTSLCSGRLEVKSEQSWSSVCEADFDQQDAEVVCRELGCGTPSVLQGALYGKVETPMWTKKFQCGGNESALLDCRRSNSTRRTCSPGKAVGLICSEPFRLVGGASRCEGTLEVKRTEWRPVSAFLWTQGNFRSRYSNWTLKEAAVACSDLDCGSAVSSRSRNEDSYRSVWWISSKCVQSGYALRGCVLSDSSSSILELTCSDLLLQPIISVSPTMDGVSGAQQQGFQVFWGSSFTISCSIQPQYPGGSFQLTFSSSNTAYNYTQPAVNHSADFLFPAADPAHQGNYSCVYGVYVFSHNFSSESRLLSLTVTGPDKTLYRTVFIIRLVVLPVALLLSNTALYFILKASRRQKSDPQENIELDYYKLGVSRAEGEPAEEEGAQGAE